MVWCKESLNLPVSLVCWSTWSYILSILSNPQILSEASSCFWPVAFPELNVSSSLRLPGIIWLPIIHLPCLLSSGTCIRAVSLPTCWPFGISHCAAEFSISLSLLLTSIMENLWSWLSSQTEDQHLLCRSIISFQALEGVQPHCWPQTHPPEGFFFWCLGSDRVAHTASCTSPALLLGAPTPIIWPSYGLSCLTVAMSVCPLHHPHELSMLIFPLQSGFVL